MVVIPDIMESTPGDPPSAARLTSPSGDIKNLTSADTCPISLCGEKEMRSLSEDMKENENPILTFLLR
jgi:hypothetical protein